MADCVRIIDLEDDERVEVRSLVERIDGSPYSDFESFYQQCLPLQNRLPVRVGTALAAIRDEHRGGALWLRGLPLRDALSSVETPTQPFAQADVPELGTEKLLVLLATVVADPYTYREWDGGAMVHNKYPIRSHRNVQFGSNAVEFLVHTETPFRNFSPDYLALLCLRGDPTGGAFTRVGDVGSIIEEMAEDELEVLRGDHFAFETDNPAVVIDGRGLTQPLPIVSERNGETVYEYVHDLVAIDERSTAVLDRLKSKVEARVSNIHLEGGDLLIIDNSHMVHGRSAYAPRYDGRDRWLQRLLLSSRLFRRGEIPESRLVSDKRLPHYPTDYQNVLKSLAPAAGGAGH